jgi:hypothetical protein
VVGQAFFGASSWIYRRIRPTNGPQVARQSDMLRPMAPTHCTADERVIFTALVEGSGKIVSLCASQRVYLNEGYVQYRFGAPGSVELEFPAGRDTTQRQFLFVRTMRAADSLATLAFTLGDTTYVLHDEIDPAAGGRITFIDLKRAASDSVLASLRLRQPTFLTLWEIEGLVRSPPAVSK